MTHDEKFAEKNFLADEYIEKDSVEIILNHLVQSGFQKVIVVTHTKPELNIPVVQIFILRMQRNR